MGHDLRAVLKDAMKTSVIEVRDVLAVLSTQQVEKRMGEEPGVASHVGRHGP